MLPIFLALFLFALAAAIAAFRVGQRLRLKTGLPTRARVVYSDTGTWERLEKPLFSRRYLLAGKPDYIVEADGAHIPVEVKPNSGAGEPLAWHTLQLAAYCLLLEETYGAAPPYGLLKYRESVFRVEFTQALRSQLLRVLDEMRGDLNTEEVARSHAETRRCLSCGYRAACGQELG